tara:strand:+ start:126 stop:1769 length:1644 start_codon:yes stop_codon:yes gene_type:complete
MANREEDWRSSAESSVLLEAVSHWREAPEEWFRGSYNRLPETVRVNPLNSQMEWVESWLNEISSKPLKWFPGPGSAWELPFDRGGAEGEVRAVLNALHDTGRLTRQEAVSMLPVLALDPKPGEVILDMCASPGSKTTQICEHLGNSGVVIANEVISGRVNTLVSNVQRHASRTTLVVHHDGRHLPKVPEIGFDRVLVDVPCTGSGTTRKNPDVWAKWLPSSGRSLHVLQSDLLARAIRVTKPGGRIVYATCSLDPVENEAVVAGAIARGGVSVVSGHKLLGGVPTSPGLTEWPALDEKGRPSEDIAIPDRMRAPSDRSLSAALGDCVRVWNDSVGGGGFFLSVLEKSPEPQGPKSHPARVGDVGKNKPDPEEFPKPISKEWTEKLEAVWGGVPSSMWVRGKSLLWSTEEAISIWESERGRRGGRVRVPGGRWYPLKVIHLGLIAARIRKGELERVVSRAAPLLIDEIDGPFIDVKGSLLDRILLNEEVLPGESGSAFSGIRGSRVLVDSGGTCLPVWIGGRVTPMVNEAEMRVLRAMRGLPIVLEDV